MSSDRLLDLWIVEGQLEVVTGLRIGASQETMEIGGNDNPIVRDPATGQPFIPGSSIRGKLRSLAEWYRGELPDRGDPAHPRHGAMTTIVFGGPASRDADKALGPTRLIVRDARLAECCLRDFRDGRPITEVKSENSINRVTGMANPRPMERVLAGVRFDIELVYRIFDLGDGGAADRDRFDEVVLKALRLLEMDALGGGSSRGNGKIRFVDLTLRKESDGTATPLILPRVTFAAVAAGTGR